MVIAPRGFEPYARYVISRSALYLDSLEAWYGVRPPIARLILNPSQDVGTDLATVQPLRVELTLTPAMDKGIRPQAGLFLDRVTGHELTHIIQFSTQAGISKPVRWLFGDAVAPLGLSPSWEMEGQAIWTESYFGGGRLHSSWHRMLWRTPLMEGSSWSAAQIAHTGLVNPPLGRAYVAGAFLYNEMDREWGGTDRAGRWMRSRAAWPSLQGIPFRRSYGVSMPALYGEFVQASAEVFQREFAGRDLAPRGEVLHCAPRTDWRSPVWTVETLVSRRESYNAPDALVRLTSTGGEERIAPLGYSPHRGITVYGEGAIVSEQRRISGESEASEVVLVRIDGAGERHELAGTPVRGWAPDYCPANRRLAWVTRDLSSGVTQLVVGELNQEGRLTDSLRLYETPLGTLADPAWSPDGTALAFVADEGEGERIFLWREGGDSLTSLSLIGVSATLDPAWSPDGTLWVSSDPGGVFDLFEINVAGGQAIRRTRVASGAYEAAPGSNGEVVYAHYTSGGFLPVLLRRDQQLADTVAFDVHEASPPAGFELSERAAGAGVRTYRTLHHIAPIFWLPLYDSSTGAGGATVLGRDPLGFLTWRAKAWYGDGSGKPEGSLALAYARYTVEFSAELSYENLYQQASYYNPYSNSIETFGEWLNRLEGSLVAQERFYFDGGGFRKSLTPWLGYTTRERHIYEGYVTPTELSVDAKPARYHGLLAGVNFSRYRTSLRDPVTRRLIAVSLNGDLSRQFERDFNSHLVRMQSRFHAPLGIGNLIAAATFNVQWQEERHVARLGYSRSAVLPVGYSEHSLVTRFNSDELLLRVGGELHFPLFYPDWGYGQGWLHVDKVRGLLFAQSALGRDVQRNGWESGLASAGGEIVLEGWAVYEASVNIRAGVAWLFDDQKSSTWLTLNAPFDLITGVHRLAESWTRFAPHGGEEPGW